MPSLCEVVLLAAITTAAPPQSGPSTDLQKAHAVDFHGNISYDVRWEDFKTEFGKSYDGAEESIRKGAFIANVKRITMHNYLYSKGKSTFKLGLNQFADMTFGEFASTRNGFSSSRIAVPDNELALLSSETYFDIPAQVDWREHGYVTPVKDQGCCPSCWAFSTTGSIEGQHFAKTGKLVSLSEQNLIDCSEEFGNAGCKGGLTDQAFVYIKENGGIDTEESYPYEAKSCHCRYQEQNRGASVSEYVNITAGSERALQQAVSSVGPIAVAIDANHISFMLYSSGVYVEAECSRTQLGHGALVVGYGSEGGLDYWLLKNSWGKRWGEEGYIKMARNMDNQCGIATSASYPVV